MRLRKWITPVIMVCLLGFPDPPARGMQAAGQKSMKEEKSADPRKARESSVSRDGKTGPVRKGTELVKKIEGGFLYTQTGQYSLSGVKVIDLTKNRKHARGAVSTPKKTAEMTFLNNQLHEVVIRQR